MTERDGPIFWAALFAAASIGLISVLANSAPDFYSELKSWQTLVAGVVGFGALAWVTHKDALNARVRDLQLAQDELQRRAYERTERSSSIAMALAWELAHTIREIVTVRRQLLEQIEAGGVSEKSFQSLMDHLKSVPAPYLYGELTSDLLLLPAAAISGLSEFYYDVADVSRPSSFTIDDTTHRRAADRLRLTVEAGNAAMRALRPVANIANFPAQFPT